MKTTLYPENPSLSTKKLTALTPSYQFRAILAILAIFVFFALYTAMVIALGYLIYYAFMYNMGIINQLTILLKIGAIAASIMLFVFTLKFVFKLKNPKPNNRIKLQKKDYPELWDFIDKICSDTGAPKPKAIYADPDVNAYVSYTNVWLSLLFPVKKELTIGLGLVSTLNLSEFKAVISHEFGHFAQRSMKIGSYINSANTIIFDMIYARDKWDDMLDQWRNADLRLSAAAWAITPVIWGIRQILGGFYQFLNIMYSSLSREMEFNADKIAVSTSGSDAIIAALWKLDKGFINWNETVNHAYLATQKNIFVQNLYVHNNFAIERSSAQQKELLHSLPMDERGGKLYFEGSENSKVSMYASHPPNDQREQNAKSPYIPCQMDDRQPWLLFRNKEALQEEMTTLLYQLYFNLKPSSYVDTQAFEDFIRAESKGNELLEEYHHTFQDRFLSVSDMTALKEAAQTIQAPNKKQLEQIKLDLQELMKPVQEIEGLMRKAQEIAQGTTKDKSFVFQGQTYQKKTVQKGYLNLSEEREKLFSESFKEWDMNFCAFHLSLAQQVGKEQTLLDLYQQHLAIIDIFKTLINVKNYVHQELHNIQSRDDVSQFEIDEFGAQINKGLDQLNAVLDDLEQLNFAALPNIDTTQELKEAIVQNGYFKKENHKRMFENGGFDRIMQTIETALSHCQRIDQKSIGFILLSHHELQEENKIKHSF
ncbi:M48 family metalloprotease [Aureispira anguillae]|uniref:M48 family metalloprotease n=1 Tax=Aureispira anguillae TaxID=2864201 RepID=A0A916DTM7_9BACT|nr:M48 family metalloprotease [Aureispira anguillae]BDS11606.1 M48 family metalloprotease [Aureispira anguillae]